MTDDKKDPQTATSEQGNDLELTITTKEGLVIDAPGQHGGELKRNLAQRHLVRVGAYLTVVVLYSPHDVAHACNWRCYWTRILRWYGQWAFLGGSSGSAHLLRCGRNIAICKLSGRSVEPTYLISSRP